MSSASRPAPTTDHSGASAAGAFALAHGLARLLLSGIFLYTGVTKLADPGALATDIANYRLLPEALAGPAALLLPVLELVVGAALLSRSHLAGGGALAGALLLAFAAAMAQAKLRGIDLNCGCFGAGVESQVSWAKVGIDVALAAPALWLWLRPAPARAGARSHGAT
ncbi:MAG: hypothetical protein OEZ06_08700 [Myxococcales bacterium]|nr:hypothetical protein [Myxococcales bacterium]